MKEWLTYIIIIAIILVVLDGFRRKIKSRNELRLKVDKNIPTIDPDDDLRAELPGGGARIRPRSGTAAPVRREPALGLDEDEDGHDTAPAPAYEEDISSFQEDEYAAPMDEQLRDELPQEVDEQPPYDSDDEDLDAEDAGPDDEGLVPEQDDVPVRLRRSGRNIPAQVFQTELPLSEDADELSEEDDDLDDDRDDEPAAVEEVIVINVMAAGGDLLSGKTMLPVLLRQGMRLGNMSIFHRHADNNGNGPVMFSMANMVKPGTFDMAQMEEFSTPGVSLFLQLPGELPHMKSFDKMLETANALKAALSGELKDENRSVLTRQTIEHYRQRIRDFELKQLSRK